MTGIVPGLREEVDPEYGLITILMTVDCLRISKKQTSMEATAWSIVSQRMP